MLYMDFVKLLEKIFSTSKRIEKTYYISELLKKTPEDDIPDVILLLQGDVFPVWDRRKLGVASQLVIKALHIASGFSIKDINDEWKTAGDLGVAAKKLMSNKKQQSLFTKPLTVSKVMNNLRQIAALEGKGSVDMKIKLIAELLGSSNGDEAKYIIRTLLGAMRIGIGEGLMRDAIAWAYLPKVLGIFVPCKHCGELTPNFERCLVCNQKLELGEINPELKTLKVSNLTSLQNLKGIDIIIPEGIGFREVYNYLINKIQDAYNLVNDFTLIAKILRTESLPGLDKVEFEVGKPIKVMLALKAENIKDAFDMVGRPAMLEYKYDGFRMQIHKKSNDIKIFTRRLEDVTPQFPDVVGFIKNNVKGTSFIIEGEAVGYDPETKEVRPFQEISQRIKRKYDIERIKKELPVELNLFDIVYLNGKSLLKTPFEKRRELLKSIVSEKKNEIVISKGIITDNDKTAENFFNEALEKGHEGLMFKKLNGPYKAGARVGYMVKLKPKAETFDLVIVGAEWGEGKRSGWLSSFYVACRDDDNFLLVGKVSTGLKEKSDEGTSFKEMTEMLRPLIIGTKGRYVKIRPEVIIEVGYQEIQKSPSYDSGFALRFPVFIRMREDKALDEITTLEEIKKTYQKYNH